MHLRDFVQVSAVTVALVVAVTTGSAASPENRHPMDPAGPAATVEYRSVFTDYRSLLETERKSWRTANDEALGAGGHAGHARPGAPASGTAADAEKPQTPTSSESRGGHSGH